MIYFVSFPKSGRSWVRFMLACYEASVRSSSLRVELERQAHGIEFNHDFFSFGKEHTSYQDDSTEPFVTISREPDEDDRTLFWLIRDPRDVVVSYYHQKTRREAIAPDLGPDAFVKDERWGIKRQCRWICQFRQTFLSWRGPKHLFRYERELISDRPFLRLFTVRYRDRLDTEVYRKAAAGSAFEEMRRFEDLLPERKDALIPILGSARLPGGEKVRRGKVGSYKEELKPTTIEWMENQPIVRTTLDVLGFRRYDAGIAVE